VAEAGFTTSRRGFHQDEVRAFLVAVAAELGRLQERERQLDAELNDLRTSVPQPVELDDDTVAELLGEETLRVLQTARESASQIKIRAEESAAQTLRDAGEEANRLRQDAEVEAARKRHDASSDAEAEVALAKQQGREMVNEARAYRERVLADLERRTKLARNQIDELVHGRDRLLQVFERARLVAVDVTSELTSIEGPGEDVNFSPTTGPVPIMVPAASPAEPAPAADDLDEADDDASDEVVDDAAVDTDDSATDDSAGDDEDDAVADEAETTAVRDANVVSLFRDRANEAGDASASDDTADDTDATATDASVETETTDTTDTESTDTETTGDADDTRPDVGGIFERLRTETADADDSDQPDVEAEQPVVAAGDTSVDDEPAEPTPFSRRDEAIVPLIVGGARKLKRVLADEQNGVLDALRQNEPVTSLDALLPEIDEHLARYVGAIDDELLGAAAAGAGEHGINDTKTLRRKLGKTGALDGATALLRADLIMPLRERLERSVTDGGGDNEAITKRVRAVYREWKTQHIDDQLDDVFRFAHGGGVAAMAEPGSPMMWTIDPSEPACPDCEDNSLAGPVAAGDPYPTGHSSAPAHTGCRCLTVPAGQ
jgi:DivIVA domain-containing protein